jgi:hypothetical protein
VDSTHRAAAGSDAPIRIVGGIRQMAQISARKQDGRHAVAHRRHIHAIEQGDHEQRQNAARADAQFQQRVHPQGMHVARANAGKRQTAEA